MNTKQIMDIALKLAGLDEIPEDSGIIVEGDNIKRVFTGVDMDTAEILLAKQLNADLVISHHPMAGRPRVNLHKVMVNQVNRMVEAGVPINKAQKALREKMDEIDRGLHSSNYDRAASAARLLGMPYMNIHTPADMMAQKTIQDHIDKRLGNNPKAKINDLLDCLNEFAEYRKTPAGPVARVGGGDDYCGRIFVTMAGGTGGGISVYKAYFEAGIGTLVVMHAKEDVIKAVKEQNIGNIVVAGHMASDSIGMNQLLYELEANGMEIIRMAGIIDPR
jgi:putative NIF3 family GTP cyclohydrolase 1 type 2